jgi:hypothetical protein
MTHIPCYIQPLTWSDDPGFQIATHFTEYHLEDMTDGLNDDTTEHLARMVNDASNDTKIDPIHILARSEQYIDDWTR